MGKREDNIGKCSDLSPLLSFTFMSTTVFEGQ